MSNIFYVVYLEGWGHICEATGPYWHDPEMRDFYNKMKMLTDKGFKRLLKMQKYLRMRKPYELIEGCKSTREFAQQGTKSGDI